MNLTRQKSNSMPNLPDTASYTPNPGSTAMCATANRRYASETLSENQERKPLSHKLLLALRTKPTLSKTWNKKEYVEEQRTAPLPRGGNNMEQMRMEQEDLRSTSLYASPAAIAAFRALPPHSAPLTPIQHATPPTTVT